MISDRLATGGLAGSAAGVPLGPNAIERLFDAAVECAAI
jgi:hypothetical protein